MREPLGDRRQAAAAVDQDRHAALGGQLEDGREPLVVQQELLRPRVQLDPARAGVEAARRLVDRALREVEPDERDEAALGARRVVERAVVRGAKAGMAVGLVEAEHERARDPVALLAPMSSSKSPIMPSTSVPRWTCASKISTSGRQLGADDRMEALDERL